MLENILSPQLDYVFCGTAASAESARRKAYYAGPGNRFWLTLYECGLTPVLLEPTEYPKLLGFGIGLTDVVKNQSGMDKEIDFSCTQVSDLHNNIACYQPGLLCFNGKKAAQMALRKQRVHYGLQDECIGCTRVVILPSTSGAARKFWNIKYWQALPQLLNSKPSR